MHAVLLLQLFQIHLLYLLLLYAHLLLPLLLYLLLQWVQPPLLRVLYTLHLPGLARRQLLQSMCC